MKFLFDSSVLIAAFVGPHPMHEHAIPWLQEAKSRKIEWVVAAHSLAEIYAALTSLPVSPRISTNAALRLIRENVPKEAVVSLSSAECMATLQAITDSNLSGGIVYDALISRAATKAKADKILTFYVRDFIRVWPRRQKDIVSPLSRLI